MAKIIRYVLRLHYELVRREAFASSPDVLAKLAFETMAEFRAGKTQELDPDNRLLSQF